MLERTFIHVQGVGPKTEQRLWARGIHTWQDFIDRGQGVLSPGIHRLMKQTLEASLKHRDDISFFNDRLSSGEMWRVFDAFKEKAVYLDIETTGYMQDGAEITVIGIYDGKTIQTFVNGINLEDFETAIAEYDLVITFNGASFDLPFIRNCFPGISLPGGHIDLRFVLKKLGYTGGLKRIEKELEITRGMDIDGVDGFEAIRLWYAYQRGNKKAPSTLIEYNNADIVNLHPLMEMGFREMKEKTLRGSES
jgi:uncharacterized protein YprB with RNaseH-like and TPR domain